MPADLRLIVNAAHVLEDGSTCEGALRQSVFDIEAGDRFSFQRPLNYHLRLSIVSGNLLVEGRLDTILCCQCDRCLKPYDHPVQAEDICHLFVIPADKIIDLTESLREDIIINFPQKCLCKYDCQGLCPVCGSNLNSDACGCQDHVDRIESWSKLDKLQL